MINKKLQNLKIMGFAKFKKKENIALDDVLKASLKWQESFIQKQEGISFHCLLSNLNGDLADIIFGADEKAFNSMLDNFSQDDSSKEFIALLDTSTTHHYQNIIMQDNFSVPNGFSGLEFGTFKTKDTTVTESNILSASDQIKKEYLSKHKENLGHFIGKTDKASYSEVAFSTTVGHAKEICNGYLENPTCMKLINLFDPESVDLDFWYPIA